jgi:pilus assembly protein Flp/PilA
MTQWHSRLRRFLTAEDGPTAVEYAVMLAFIISVCVVAITAVGNATNNTYSNATLGAALAGSSSS